MKSSQISGGLRRLKFVIRPNGPLPVGRSTFLAGVRTGRYPAPVKLGPRITAWRDEDIRKLIEVRVGDSFWRITLGCLLD
jgi:prophage regulatory protein